MFCLDFVFRIYDLFFSHKRINNFLCEHVSLNYYFLITHVDNLDEINILF